VVYLVLEFREKKHTFAKVEGVMWTFSFFFGGKYFFLRKLSPSYSAIIRVGVTNTIRWS
jgi:hypothetical protein